MSSNSNAFKQDKNPGGVNGFFKGLGLAIVALAIIGLIFSSVYSGGGGRNSLVFGSYGNKNIEYSYDNAFGRAVESEMSKYNASVDQDNQFFTFVRFMAWQQAFNNVAVNAAIEYHLEDSGYEVSSRALDRRIVDFGPFRTDGQFDEIKYRAASQVQKDSVREQFREQIALETWSEDVLYAPYRSSKEMDFLESMRSTARTYDYVTIPFSDFPDEKVLEYGESNPGLFARMAVSRITVSDEETAGTVVSEYEEKRTAIDAFADLAAEYSRDAYSEDGGSMGETDYYRVTELIGAEAADEVFALGESDIAGPFETEYGWMIFRSDGSPVESDLAARIDDIRSYMLQNEVGIVEDALLADVERLRVKAMADGDFRTASAEAGYTVATTAAFPVNFGGDTLLGAAPENSGAVELSGTNESEDFWGAVIPLSDIGDVSEPVVLSGAVALFSLAGIEEIERLDYWDSMVDYETARSRQTDFQVAVLGEESTLFKSEFSESYARIFPEQG